jgi:hypothetical protein
MQATKAVFITSLYMHDMKFIKNLKSALNTRIAESHCDILLKLVLVAF